MAGSDGPLANHILTGGSDGLIKLWRSAGSKFEVVQTIDLKGKLPLDLELGTLPGSDGEHFSHTIVRRSGS